MKSIDTFYNGNYYRSRLEARWAYFFDRLGVKYLYEPEGFKHGNERYLPDFYLPETYLRNNEGKGVYIEIKHQNFKEANFSKHWFDENLVLFCGPPLVNIWGVWGNYGFQIYPYWDNAMNFWICKDCKTTKIEFSEGSYNRCPECYRSCDKELLLFVATDTQYLRFEHKKQLQ